LLSKLVPSWKYTFFSGLLLAIFFSALRRLTQVLKGYLNE